VTPSPTPTALTTLDYAAHLSSTGDVLFAVAVVVGLLILVSLGILTARGIA
jgi:hypothetical protein